MFFLNNLLDVVFLYEPCEIEFNEDRYDAVAKLQMRNKIVWNLKIVSIIFIKTCT